MREIERRDRETDLDREIERDKERQRETKLNKMSTYRELDHESVDNGAHDGDKVEYVPVVFEIALNRSKGS